MNKFRYMSFAKPGMVSVGLVVGIVVLGVTTSGIAGEAPLPSHEELVKETVTLIRQLDEHSRIDALIQLASVEGSLGKKDSAHALFLEVIQTLRTSPVESSLEDLVRAERNVGAHAALEETLPVALSIIGSTAKEDSDTGVEQKKSEYYRLSRLLTKAGLYASAGKVDQAKEMVREVVRALPTRQRSDQDQLRQSLAIRQGQIGDETGAQATLRDLESYFKKMSAEMSPVHMNPLVAYWHEVGLYVDVAQAQHRAGYSAAAKATLKKVFQKAGSIPVSSNGDAGPRSAAFKRLVMGAVEIGEAQLALAAEREIQDEGYTGVLGMVVMALAKQGDVRLAHQLARDHHCCGFHLAVGLSERGEWEAAALAEENPNYRCACCECSWDDEEVENGRRIVSRAVVHARGVSKALERVAGSKHTDMKVQILLGILEAMNCRTHDFI